MSYQKNPIRVPSFMRAADGTWNTIPLVVAATGLVLAAYVLWGGDGYFNRLSPAATEQTAPTPTVR